MTDNFTFPDNDSTFMANHAYVEDGNLVLKLDSTLSPTPQPQPRPTPGPSPTPDD
jgi:hypothetical protein